MKTQQLSVFALLFMFLGLFVSSCTTDSQDQVAPSVERLDAGKSYLNKVAQLEGKQLTEDINSRSVNLTSYNGGEILLVSVSGRNSGLQTPVPEGKYKLYFTANRPEIKSFQFGVWEPTFDKTSFFYSGNVNNNSTNTTANGIIEVTAASSSNFTQVVYLYGELDNKNNIAYGDQPDDFHPWHMVLVKQ